MRLDGRQAVIYGGAGRIGAAVGRAFADAGAHVHLAGRTAATLERTTHAIRANGGTSDPAVVDALDADAVDAHAAEIAAAHGGIDVSFNLIAHPHRHGVPLIDLCPDVYMAPVEVAARSTFVTARAAARQMVERGGGTILILEGPAIAAGRRATTSSAAPSSPSTHSSRCGASSPSSWAAVGCAW